jgi:transmembrane sensor
MKGRRNIWTLMARYLAGEMNMNEEIEFRDRLESNQQQSELKQMEQSWKYFNDQPAHGGSDPGKAWDKLYHRLEDDGLMDGQKSASGRRNLAPALKIAATILLILGIGIPAVYLDSHRTGMDKEMQNHYAEKGVSAVDLPDGSRVFLNQGAEISYPESFEQGREVKLKGEAFFEVMSDPVNPFTVRSGKVVISVLGTSFNVKKERKADVVEVFVESGKVRVFMENSGEFITLEPGDIGHIGPSHLESNEQLDPNYISWKTKDFKFVDEELLHVLRELEESYHVRIHAEDVPMDDLRITTAYREQSIDAILETIGTAFGLSVSKKEDSYYLEN